MTNDQTIEDHRGIGHSTDIVMNRQIFCKIIVINPQCEIQNWPTEP